MLNFSSVQMRFIAAIAILLLSTNTIAIAQTPPNKPTWPVEFDAAFGLNIPAAPNFEGIFNSSSHFYYNWDQVQSSLIVYDDACIPLFNVRYLHWLNSIRAHKSFRANYTLITMERFSRYLNMD